MTHKQPQDSIILTKVGQQYCPEYYQVVRVWGAALVRGESPQEVRVASTPLTTDVQGSGSGVGSRTK